MVSDGAERGRGALLSSPITSSPLASFMLVSGNKRTGGGTNFLEVYLGLLGAGVPALCRYSEVCSFRWPLLYPPILTLKQVVWLSTIFHDRKDAPVISIHMAGNHKRFHFASREKISVCRTRRSFDLEAFGSGSAYTVERQMNGHLPMFKSSPAVRS